MPRSPAVGPAPAFPLKWLIASLLAALLLMSLPARALGDDTRHLHASLVAESLTPAAGRPVTLAIVLAPEAGWHDYWQNPGMTGYAPALTWTVPTGVRVGRVRFPAPVRLVAGGLTAHVLTGAHALLVTLDVPAGLAAGTALPITVSADWLVCSADTCVPETARLRLDLKVGDGAVAVADALRFDHWRAAEPRALGATATFTVARRDLRVSIPYPASADAHNAWLYAAAPDQIDAGAPQQVHRDGDRLIVNARLAETANPFTAIDAVLVTGAHGALAFHAVQGTIPSATDRIPWRMIAVALGGALLGGLILNIMPCVFPVIGLKAISLARGGGDERTVRREALAYAAGVILVCMALGGAMLGLRAAGHMVGWAFQLQDPRVILLMLLLLTAITANLAGVFELSSFGGGDRLTHKHGLAGSFWTGALAAFVATPCTGPFMAAALGTALVLPTVAALATFAGLGLGLALPFLALAYIPALRTRLPKPGHWMVYVRTLMAIPMGLSALGLAWLLSRQAGTTGLAIGMAAAAAVVAGLWLIGRAQRRDYGAARIGWMPITAAVVVGLATIVPVAAGEQPTGGMAHAEPFSENRLARLRAQHRPAFVYFTADWCLTCKVNEKSALETREVAHAFEQRGIAVLVGDWTNGDSAISRFLALSGRSGVPLYLYYPPGKPVPIELPQVLTIGTLLALDA